MASGDYQLVWASGQESMLVGYVVSFGSLQDVRVVRAFVFDSKKAATVGEVHEYLVSDFASPNELTDRVHETLKKDGAEAIFYRNKVFPMQALSEDLKVNLPFLGVRKAE